MKKFILCSLITLIFLSNALAQQPNELPAWDVTLAQNTSAGSNLTVQNRCGKRHSFQIEKENVPFLNFSQTQVNVNGGQNIDVPVRFNTQNLPPGLHQGFVLVICLTCSSEPTCTQDRERLQVKLNITTSPNQPGQNQPPNNQPPNDLPQNPPNNPMQSTDVQYVSTTRPWFLETPPLLIDDDVCDVVKRDCEELRRIAWEKEAAAAAAQNVSDVVHEGLEQAEKRAKAAEDAAKLAEDSAEPADSDYKARVNDQEYSSADTAYLEVLRQQNNANLASGAITAAEHQRRANELTAKKAREERLANEAKLEKEAQATRAKADREKAAANEAKKAADVAQKAADKSRVEADAARKAYEECIKKLEEECRLLEEERKRAVEEQRKKEEAKKSAAAAQRLKEEEKKQADEAEKLRLAHRKYLLDNIKQLGLISSAPYKDVPGAFDGVIDKIIPDILGKTVEGVVNEMVTQAAEYATNSPIPISSIQALGGLYQIIGKMLDPCSPLGSPRIMVRLEGMINPKTGRKYTPDEAQNKTFEMCKLLRELKSKIEAIKRLHEQKTK